MRIISFSKKWQKLRQIEFTTFRFPRKDTVKGRDWHIGEVVQVYYKNRSPKREFLGIAEITDKSPRWVVNRILGNEGVGIIEGEEARADGFTGCGEMEGWLIKEYGSKRIWEEPMNKLTLRWQSPSGVEE